MDKIIILADYFGENHKLVKCLCKLFPECKIQILSTPTESTDDTPVEPEASPEITEARNGKHPNYR